MHIEVLRAELDLQLLSGKFSCCNPVYNQDRAAAKTENEDEVAQSHLTSENTTPGLLLLPRFFGWSRQSHDCKNLLWTKIGAWLGNSAGP